ncbi:hypothetical protein CP533_2549 [Ophiocordyceps camponoti-saundersi (nom. inval.)]|nr:hypothetical protein CP533_2549 [Ophiocordyceps camponoti-saundersi (nom. inval.)]
MVAPFRVKAVYEYSSPHEDDLNFPIGQIITVTEEEDDDWYGGEYVDGAGTKHEGIFPRNFVEKYEPTAPPRPVRARPKKDSVEAAPQQQQQQQQQLQQQFSPEDAAFSSSTGPSQAEPPVLPKQEPPEAVEAVEPAPTRSPIESPTAREPVPPLPKASDPAPVPASPAAASPPAPKAKPAAPAPLTEKPSSNSFKDRIAAFNKPAAPPVAPFKPSGLGGASGSAGFIKKPFVAPPPSRNAYVPPPRDTPSAPIYKREEDADSKERVPASPDQADKPRAVVPGPSQDGGDEEQPKPTSLKERIALLQKQQMEQAHRHADAAAKKEKPKKPPKKRPEQDIASGDTAAEVPPPAVTSPREVDEAGTRTSTDEAASSRVPPTPRRKSSKEPAAESVHDGNDADMSGAGDTTEDHDDTTERDDSDGASRRLARRPSTAATPTAKKEAESESEPEGEGEGEAEEEEEEEVDPEVKRKEELRARMAKMSGGMGFHGMFGAPMPPTATSGLKKKASRPEASSAGDEATSPVSRAAPPIPTLMALPGMGGGGGGGSVKASEENSSPKVASAPSIPARASEAVPKDDKNKDAEKEKEKGDEGEEKDEEEEEAKTPAALPDPKLSRRGTGGRSAPPPPVQLESRSARDIKSATEGSESDDELSGAGTAARSPPAVQSPAQPTRSPPMSPRAAEYSPTSPPAASKRISRAPPPVPGSAPALPPASTRPPPLPPVAVDESAMPPRPAVAGDEENEENTEYEGDYDTDIASSVPHKDALKSHARDSSVDEKAPLSPTTDVRAAPRGVPPPIPSQPPPSEGSKRRSIEAVREDDDVRSQPSPASGRHPYLPAAKMEDVVRGGPAAPPPDRRLPSLPGSSGRGAGRPSMDASRPSMSGRPSVDMNRNPTEGFIASDLDLAAHSGWWRQPMAVPPALQGRRDVLYESDESATTNQGSKTVVTRAIYVLFQDYSQTVVTARFDPYRTSDGVELEQHHEGPPRALRQDQMEEFHERYGVKLLAAAAAAKDTVVGDGTAQGLVTELLRPHRDALAPVGTRSYGALVYANMANASTQQHDVIRPGDIMSTRNARFQGKHGPMHAKYTMDVGKPDHVAVVAEWDGTKKKVKAWEQGRESKKVKLESFKLDDLRSGEVKIWRVVPRSWVGWSG